MSKGPDAWEDEWSNAADTTTAPPAETLEPKKTSSKVTKAQRRAQQQEFNRQIWAQAEGPKETNYFLESRNVIPLRSEFKPPPVLLSRKGPVVASRKPPTNGVASLILKDESSEDEEEETKKQTLDEIKAQRDKEREEKQRKYEERRQELFGTTNNALPKSSSGNSSPNNLTPPHSRSATPSRARGRGGRRGGSNTTPSQPRPPRELYEPSYSPKPDSAYVQRREAGTPKPNENEIKPVRAPKGPDGSGRGGFGFVARGGRPLSVTQTNAPALKTT